MFQTKETKPVNGNGHGPVLAPAPATAPRVEMPLAMTVVELKKPVLNVISEGSIVEGNIIAEGDVTIHGTVRGDVTSKTKLIAGPTSVIEGNILADHAEIAGLVRGTVQTSGLLVIKASCVIEGDVVTRNLNVESGATFHGRFQVGGKTEALPKTVK